MELECVKKMLEKGMERASVVDGLPWKFIEHLCMNGLQIHLMEPAHVLCSMNITPRLLNSNNSFHGGAAALLVDVVGAAVIPSPLTSGVSVEINVSYFDAAYLHEEIEIDARLLRFGKAVAVVSVEFRKKKSGKIFAQGRHTKYLALASKL
ncbi:hypothetical protein Ahy_B08g089094 [Arachis hypogaea]|uniref:Acyl-coenzyme A thioesterase 13 n=1 Tax=Arachis hypogaea TaxID=3818 RepID=A0A444XWS6_ARAHY|nr:hypothetical protein Ahy_B08g089094 [Arachis hypogaea]